MKRAMHLRIHDNAVFRFNDGDFVGKQAVRGAFEKTWKGNANVRKDRFCLTDIEVLVVDAKSAATTYTYHWEWLGGWAIVSHPGQRNAGARRGKRAVADHP